MFGLPVTARITGAARDRDGVANGRSERPRPDRRRGRRPAVTRASFVIVGHAASRITRTMWTRSCRSGTRDRISAFVGFDERRAHLVEGGADIFLMPSRFEPCGLNQMYSMRYGTVPVVRAVGGLVDTVRPYNPRNGQGTGFLFSEYRPDALLDALGRRARSLRQQEAPGRGCRKMACAADFSWDRSAAEYVKMYKRVRRASRRHRRAFSASNRQRTSWHLRRSRRLPTRISKNR